jgi:amino acid transporter
MPNHHMADEKAFEATPHSYEESNVGFEEPFVHSAATVGGETGRGGDTHRGLKSRHIQFLYVTIFLQCADYRH